MTTWIAGHDFGGCIPRVAMLLLDKERFHFQVQVIPGSSMCIPVPRPGGLPLLLRQNLEHLLLSAQHVTMTSQMKVCIRVSAHVQAA